MACAAQAGAVAGMTSLNPITNSAGLGEARSASAAAARQAAGNFGFGRNARSSQHFRTTFRRPYETSPATGRTAASTPPEPSEMRLNRRRPEILWFSCESAQQGVEIFELEGSNAGTVSQFAPGRRNLGALRSTGEGVPRGAVQAYLWFDLAAAQGDAEAGESRDPSRPI